MSHVNRICFLNRFCVPDSISITQCNFELFAIIRSVKRPEHKTLKRNLMSVFPQICFITFVPYSGLQAHMMALTINKFNKMSVIYYVTICA